MASARLKDDRYDAHLSTSVGFSPIVLLLLSSGIRERKFQVLRAADAAVTRLTCPALFAQVKAHLQLPQFREYSACQWVRTGGPPLSGEAGPLHAAPRVTA